MVVVHLVQHSVIVTYIYKITKKEHSHVAYENGYPAWQFKVKQV
jgi:hypothetical protein